MEKEVCSLGRARTLLYVLLLFSIPVCRVFRIQSLLVWGITFPPNGAASLFRYSVSVNLMWRIPVCFFVGGSLGQGTPIPRGKVVQYWFVCNVVWFEIVRVNKCSTVFSRYCSGAVAFFDWFSLETQVMKIVHKLRVEASRNNHHRKLNVFAWLVFSCRLRFCCGIYKS